MKTTYYLLLTVLILVLAACKNEETPSCTVHIQLLPPEGYSTLAFGEMEVTLTNKAQGTAYTSRCSAAGLASFNVEYGYYTASVHYQASSGLIFSGRLESLPLLPEQGETAGTVNIQLIRSASNALVIKEIYYSGCKSAEGMMYLADQYVTLYNNSDTILYLDGLCVGVVDPSNSLESPWLATSAEMKRIPVNDLTWQFPGSGKEHPLQPGAETTIATNAINHSGGEFQHVNSVDLSKVDWGFWDAALDNQIEAGVKPMNLAAKLNSSTWLYSFPVIGPAFMIFSMQGTTVEDYANNPANLEPKPKATNPNKRYLMIPKEWVIDCIDCVAGFDQLPLKRVPNELDSGAAYLPLGAYSGKSLIRKKTINVDGRTIYQDTNNSTNDLEVSEPTLKKN